MAFFGLFGDNPQPAPVNMSTPMPPAAANPASDAASAIPPEFSLTDNANGILRATLAKQPVTRYGNQGAVGFPVKEVSFKPSSYNFIQTDEKAIPHGEKVTFEVTLSPNPIHDYNSASLNAALLNTLSAIPVFTGKIAAKPIEPHPQTYGDVWKALKPLLEQKQGAFTAHELGMIDQFFAANQGKDDTANTDNYYVNRSNNAISARNNDGKINISIQSAKLPQDETAAASGDAVIAEYFKAHHDHILAQVKEKAIALGIVKPDDLAQLDMHMEITGWDVLAEFSNKVSITTDPKTGAKLSDSEIAEAKKTPLANINTKQLERIFTDVLLASGKELPPILPRIMDGHMLAGIIRQRTNNDSTIDAVLKKHEMFKSETDLKAEKEAAAKEHKVMIDAMKIDLPSERGFAGKNSDKSTKVSLEFELPPGVTFTQVQENIVNAARQMQVAAQPRTGAAVGVAG